MKEFQKSAEGMMKEFLKWTEPMKTMRSAK